MQHARLSSGSAGLLRISSSTVLRRVPAADGWCERCGRETAPGESVPADYVRAPDTTCEARVDPEPPTVSDLAARPRSRKPYHGPLSAAAIRQDRSKH
jgi:hypothetical protein